VLNMTINFPHNDNLYHYMELYCNAKPFILGGVQENGSS
jgi:hypothetical protein